MRRNITAKEARDAMIRRAVSLELALQAAFWGNAEACEQALEGARSADDELGKMARA